MILAIDIGNTNVVLGGVEGEKICFEVRLATDLVKTSDQYCAEMKPMLELFHVEPEQIEGAIISSVVPPVLNSFKSAIRKLTGKTPLVVGPGLKTGLNILIDSPAQAGADLVVGAVSALRKYRPPMIIVDMGTATTISVLDQNGALLGGSISPGVKISMEALTERTAQLPGISLDQPKRAIGRNTIDCMRAGIMYGAAGMVDGLVERMEKELGQKATVIATGGIARFVLPLCKTEMIYDRDLLIRGLAILYRENQRGTGTR